MILKYQTFVICTETSKDRGIKHAHYFICFVTIFYQTNIFLLKSNLFKTPEYYKNHVEFRFQAFRRASRDLVFIEI